MARLWNETSCCATLAQEIPALALHLRVELSRSRCWFAQPTQSLNRGAFHPARSSNHCTEGRGCSFGFHNVNWGGYPFIDGHPQQWTWKDFSETFIQTPLIRAITLSDGGFFWLACCGDLSLPRDWPSITRGEPDEESGERQHCRRTKNDKQQHSQLIILAACPRYAGLGGSCHSPYSSRTPSLLKG